jgi:hypothetical protein
MSSLLEFLGATIGVMSAAALATLFLEMNFIEGVIPDALKTEQFDNRINDCYELLLTQLLRLLQSKLPSQRTEIGKVRWRCRVSPLFVCALANSSNNPVMIGVPPCQVCFCGRCCLLHARTAAS